MSQIKAKIQADLKAALKKREAVPISTLRLLLSDVHNLEIQKKRDASEDDVLAVLGKSMKAHQDSVVQFRQGGREDLASKEEQELRVIESYLPPALSAEELQKLVREAVMEAKALILIPNQSAVMKILMPKVKRRASGQAVSDLVKQELAKV